MTRELLVVAFHFPPLASSGTFRTLSFVRHLERLGWRSTVVTVAETTAAPRDEALLAQVPASVRVVRARSGDPVAGLKRLLSLGRDGRAPEAKPAAASPGEPGGAKRRGGLVEAVTRLLQIPDKESPFAVTAALAAIRAHGDVIRAADADRPAPDAVLASGPPMSGLVAGALAARALGAPLVADFRDPWTANPFRESGGGLARGLDAALERFVLRTASVAILNTPAARDALAAAHPELDARRLAVVENGFDPAELPAAPASSRSDGLEIWHLGVLYGRRDPTPLLRAAARLLAEDRALRGRLRFRFVGFPGDERFGEERLRAAAGGDPAVVTVEGSRPHAAALAEMVRADVLLLLGVSAAGPEVQVPAKLFEYLATGRPILATCHPEGAIAAVLRESRARVFQAPPDDEDALLAALRALAAAARRGELGAAPSALPERFDRARQAERLAELLEVACYLRPQAPGNPSSSKSSQPDPRETPKS